MTKRVVLIGHPVAHSLSGAMQQAAFDDQGIDAVYELWDRPPIGLGDAVHLDLAGRSVAFRIAPAPQGSHLTVFIEYRWPISPWLYLPARLLARAYARWCCRQMVRDARKLPS